jgi:predicted small secreted protein
MIFSFRIRQVLVAAIALLPLILAACNNGNSSGY